jgi:DNA-binding transcriptional LysR family regulator
VFEISTRVLRAMIALDELRHFSLAAERCHVTQSALSQMISKLERDVNIRLVDRDRRRVTLTRRASVSSPPRAA